MTGPRIRIARPGPGKGWRWTRGAGMESKRPNARTSSGYEIKCFIAGSLHEGKETIHTFEQFAKRLY